MHLSEELSSLSTTSVARKRKNSDYECETSCGKINALFFFVLITYNIIFRGSY